MAGDMQRSFDTCKFYTCKAFDTCRLHCLRYARDEEHMNYILNQVVDIKWVKMRRKRDSVFEKFDDSNDEDDDKDNDKDNNKMDRNDSNDKKKIITIMLTIIV